jgi:hypothetical protein
MKMVWQQAEFLKVNSNWHHKLTLGSEELNVTHSFTLSDSKLEDTMMKTLD